MANTNLLALRILTQNLLLELPLLALPLLVLLQRLLPLAVRLLRPPLLAQRLQTLLLVCTF